MGGMEEAKSRIEGVELKRFKNPSYYHPSQSLLDSDPTEIFDFVYYQGPKIPSPPSFVPSSLYGINERPYEDGNKTVLKVCLDSVYELKVVNPTTASHPFHMHTNHFQVVSALCGDTSKGEELRECDTSPDYVKGDWRDTITPPSPGEVVVRFQPRDWVGDSFAHCHIFGHEDRGMAVKVIISDCKGNS